MDLMDPFRPDPARGAPAASPDLDALRRRIAALERRQAALEDGAQGSAAAPWRAGPERLDAALPADGLAPDGLHEAAGAAHGDGPAAAAFLAALLRRLERRDGRDTVLVCQSRPAALRFGRLHGPGWRDLGLDPGRLLLAAVRRDGDVLWAMEEGLRCGALAAVLAEAEGPDLTASRRLALAAREGATPALLLRHDGLAPASAALSRWRVAALPGAADPFDARAPGAPRWRLDLVRCRGGRPIRCDVEWNRETGAFALAAVLADRPAAPAARPDGPRPAGEPRPAERHGLDRRAG